MDSEVLTLLLTARYVGSPAFNSLSADIDTLIGKTSGLAKAGAAISAVGTGITALTVALAIGVGESIKNASKFQNEMNRTWSVLTDGGKNTTDLTGKVFSQLEAQIIQTSDTYGQSADNIAQGSYFIMSALGGMGYKASDVVNNQIIPAFGAFVTASGNGLQGAVDWVTGAKQVVHILGAMHEPITQWANDLGVLTAAENNSALSQTNLVGALTRFAPMARLFNLSFKQTVGLISAESEAGVYGSLAGTEANSAYRLLFTSPSSLKALTALGITRDQLLKGSGATPTAMDPGLMFALLQGKLQQQTDPAKRIKLASELFGAVGFRAFGPLMQQYAASNLAMAGSPTYYQAIMAKLQGSGLQSMLGVSGSMMNSFAAQVARLGANFHNFLTLIGGPLIMGLTPVIKRLADALQSLNNALLNLGTKYGGGSGGIFTGLSKKLGWLPGALGGTIGAGAILGPGMQWGGGLLRDWANMQTKQHEAGLKAFEQWQGRTQLQESQWLTRIEGRRQEMATRHQDLLDQLLTRNSARRDFYGQAESRAQADILSQRAGRRTDYSQALSLWNAQRAQARREYAQYLQDFMAKQPKPRTLGQMTKEEARLLSLGRGPGGVIPTSGSAEQAWLDYFDQEAKAAAKTPRPFLFTKKRPQLDRSPVPAEGRLASILRQRDQFEKVAANHEQALKANQSRAKSMFEQWAQNHLGFLKQQADLTKPKVPPSAEEAARGFMGRMFGGIWHFGQALSPFHWMQSGIGRFFPNLGSKVRGGWFGGMTHLGDFFKNHANALDNLRPHLANFFNMLPGRVKGGASTAWNFIKNFDTDTWPKVRASISKFFTDLSHTVVDSIKNFGNMVKHGAVSAVKGIRDAGKFLGTHAVGLAKTIGHGIKAAPGLAWRGIKAAPGLAWRGIKAAPGLALQGIRGAGGLALRGIKAAPGFVGGLLKGGASGLFAGVNALFKGGMNFLPKLIEGFKNIGPAIISAGTAVISFGATLLPIIAVVLLIVGAVTVLVLIFTRFRKEAAQVGKAILAGLAPIFKWMMSVIIGTLHMVGKAWNDHKKQIDAAIKGLLQAFKAALPFFQVVFGIIAGVIAVVVRVIGWLVGAFIDALPHIIKFFSAIFKMLGDLGRIILDVIHGNWGQAWKDAQALLGHAWEGIQQLLGTLWTFIAGIFTRLWKDIGPTVTRFWNGFIAALPGIWKAIQNFFGSLGSKVGPALNDLWTNHLQPFFQSLPGKIGGAIGNIWDAIFGGGGGGGGGKGGKGLKKVNAATAGIDGTAFVNAFVAPFQGLGAKVLPALGKFWTNTLQPFLASLPGKVATLLGNGLGNLGKLIFTGHKGGIGGSIFGMALPGIMNALKTLGPKILPALGKITQFFLGVWKGIGAKLPPILHQLWTTKLLPFFKSLPGLIFHALLNIPKISIQLWKLFFTKGVPALWTFFTKYWVPFWNSLPGRIFNFLLLVAKKMEEFWKNVGPKIVPFLWMLWSKYIFPFFESLPGKILQLILFLLPKLDHFFSQVERKAEQKLGQLWKQTIFPFFQSLPGKILQAIQSLDKSLADFFGKIGQNAVSAFGKALGGLGSAFRGAIDRIPGGSAMAKMLHIPGFAKGGDVLHRTLAMVGEKGPELVALPGGAHVYPHDQTTAMMRPLGGGSKMLQLRVASLHVDNLHGLEHLGQEKQPPGKTQRTPAEEYLFTREIQRQRESVWDRYPNTSRNFDNTYRRAYQYYG